MRLPWSIPLFALLAAACRPQDIDPMEEQPKLLPYAESEQFADHRAMRAPPDGTVPRERQSEAPPATLTPELMALGREKFDIVCATCHGLTGDGDSIVAGKMSLRAPPSLHEPRLRALSADALYRVITDGYGLMPRYLNVLGPRERWAVVAYVRALQLSQSTPLADAPDEIRRSLSGAP